MEISSSEEQLFRTAGLPVRHLELLLRLSRMPLPPPTTPLNGSLDLSAPTLRHGFVDLRVTEELVKLSDAALTARLSVLSMPGSEEAHFVAMLYIWRTLQALRTVLRPDPLAPHVHAERITCVRNAGIIHKIVQLIHRVDTYAPILRDELFHVKLELLCADILLAFIVRSPAKDPSCLLLASESDFVMLVRTLETKLRYQTWKSADVRLLLSRLVHVLCVLLSNERALAALRRLCKDKKKTKTGDVISPVLCACICLLLGSPELSAQLQGVKLLGNAAALAIKLYRGFGVLDALLEPLQNRSAEYIHDAGAVLLQSHASTKKANALLEDAIACGAVKALVGALARPEREVREKSLLLLCSLCCPTLIGKSKSRRNFAVAVKYLTPLGPAAPLLLQSASKEPSRAALDSLLTLLEQSASRGNSLRMKESQN